METVKTETVFNSKSSCSTVSYINETDVNKMSKEKEDELLFGAEEDGDEEEILSDDSLRLRLSDDEDAEQEYITTIHTNMTDLKSQSRKTEQMVVSVIAESKSCSDTEQVIEEIISDSEDITQKEHVTDGDMHKKENISANISNCSSKSYPNFTVTKNTEEKLVSSNIPDNLKIFNGLKEIQTSVNDKMKSNTDNKEVFEVINNVMSKLQSNHAHDKNIIDIEIINNDMKKEDKEIKSTSKSNEDLKTIKVSNVHLNTLIEQHASVKHNVSTNNSMKLDNLQDIELNRNKDHLQDIINNYNVIIKNTPTCKLNNTDNNGTHVNSLEICNSEKSLTAVIISNSNDNNVKIISNKAVVNTITNNIKCAKSSLHTAEDDNKQIYMDTIKSNNVESNLSFGKDSIENKNRKRCTENNDVTVNENISKIQSVQLETYTTLIPTQDNFDVKDEVINNDHDHEHVSHIIDNNSSSTSCTLLTSTSTANIDDENINDAEIIIQKKKRSKKMIDAVQDYTVEEDKQGEKESDGHRRKTAQNVEEAVKKKFLNNDSDSNDTEQFATLNHKSNQDIYSSPSSLKRNCSDSECITSNGVVKKVKMNIELEEKNAANNITNLSFIEKFFQRNITDKLPKFTQEELEELLIQKIVETITMRSEIGKLREQARISEKNQEATRTRLQQLTKQVKDFEMVLNRNAIDRRANPDKLVAPIKINRSVGLQVNFITEHGMQNLRQLQQNSRTSTNITSNFNSSVPESNSNGTSPRRGIKVRSPRRSETSISASTPTISQNSVQTAPLISTVTPAALVVAKPLESQHTLTQANAVQQLLPASQQQIQTQPHQAIVLNGKLQNQINRQNTTLIAPKPRNNDLIDLTDEEEKSKSNVKVMTGTSSISDQQLNTASKPAQCYQRVIQTIPTNIAITTQPTIRVVQPNPPTPTALVNNSPRLTYVMQSGVGSTRQLLITSNASQIRPVTTCNRPSFSTVAYKAGISTIANGTVRVLTTPAVSNIQINKHPAPLPDTPTYTITPGWKLPPPAPSLKISKVSNGIVLSWNMMLSDKYADIASYQLYAYQEMAGVTPSTALWKKVGDVRALPLPMACTLTQFSEGNNYYFAVRAVDTHSRKGQYSIPGNISL